MYVKEHGISDHQLIHDRMHGKTVHEDMHHKNIYSDMLLNIWQIAKIDLDMILRKNSNN